MGSIPITLNFEADNPVGIMTLSYELERFLLEHHRGVRLSVAVSHAEKDNPKLLQVALITEVRPSEESEVRRQNAIDGINLDDIRKTAMALSGLTDTIYLGDAIREQTKVLQETEMRIQHIIKE